MWNHCTIINVKFVRENSFVEDHFIKKLGNLRQEIKQFSKIYIGKTGKLNIIPWERMLNRSKAKTI